MRTIRILFIVYICFLQGLFAQNIPNPVLPGVADAGVIKYAGKYYIGGVGTNGSFYVSDDLVHWEGPVHVFSMDNNWKQSPGVGDNQIHANDMMYLNGKFHLYWSVNYWGRDKHAVHIAHAESDRILGPYIEPDKENWMDNRIDPKVFKDDDGRLYMYMVRFTDGNTIWVRPMQDAATFSGDPVCLFASLPGTWERMDNQVAEGPWVWKYRNRYYMMYNANHTGPEWGNYQLGIAEAGSPLSFNNGNKYAYPVLLSNQTGLEETYVDLLRYGPDYHPLFSYTVDTPAGNWKEISYNDTGWKKGKGGFIAREIKGSTSRRTGTLWNTPAIYLRKTFFADKDSVGNLALRVTHEGDTKVYLNGTCIYNKTGAGYRILNLGETQLQPLKTGENVLAVETTKGHSNNYIDVSLFDLKKEKADDILYTPGQPNVLRGPNGFEWWLVYMANKNREPRSQYINRIHFFDKTCYAEGITGKNTKGYHPVPTRPTFAKAVEDSRSWKEPWKLLETRPAEDYYFEVTLNATADAGIIAWWKNKDNWVKIGLDAATHTWYFKTSAAGKITKYSYSLPEDFPFQVDHSFIVERNGNKFRVRLDEIPAPGKAEFVIDIKERGIPGLFTEKGNATFHGIIYTIGWDEWDENINGWNITSAGNNFEVNPEGLKVTGKNELDALKGDKLLQYEYSLQITQPTEEGVAGIYAAYADKHNYVKVVFDYADKNLQAIEVRQGKEIKRKNYPLHGLRTHYADIKYTDFIEKGYVFSSPTWMNEIRLNRHAVDNNELFVENMFEKVSVEFKRNGKWHSFQNTQEEIAAHPGYNRLSFTPVKAEALRFINREADDLHTYLYKIQVNELWKESYNLRIVKKKDKILLFVDGKEIDVLNICLPESKVGLYSLGCTPVFNGILRYDLPEVE
ncbi:family 43 glycosylhydrolase [Parabacteroides pacaensis]|uniref:family 43 glycosylhydrolase n=1 Tax=Parabacteroides pacaensis TaxID=2086575 RepID=UPI000D0F5DEC|nr:family 43 glycosylhydrolase [Parabacteroides pacaensis]